MVTQLAIPIESPASGAIFSIDGVYRYRLWRVWDPDLPRVLWVMLNPSTADAQTLDPTIRKCIGFSQRWAMGALEVVNLFALKATDPQVMLKHPAPEGPENDDRILAAAAEARLIVCAWGAHGFHRDRAQHVEALLRGAGHSLTALAFTKGHPVQPRHPLYVSYLSDNARDPITKKQKDRLPIHYAP